MMEELQIAPKSLQVKVYHRRHRDADSERPKAFWKDGWHMTTFELGDILRSETSKTSALSDGADATVKALVESVPEMLDAAMARTEKLKDGEHGYAHEVSALSLVEATSEASREQVKTTLADLGLETPSANGVDADKVWLRTGMEILDTDGATGMTNFPTTCEHQFLGGMAYAGPLLISMSPPWNRYQGNRATW